MKTPCIFPESCMKLSGSDSILLMVNTPFKVISVLQIYNNFLAYFTAFYVRKYAKLQLY